MIMKKFLRKKIINYFALLFFLIQFSIIFIIFFFSDSAIYACKKELLLSNQSIFISSLLITIILIIFLSKREGDFKLNQEFYFIIIASVFLFIIQIFITKNIYFKTGWDVGWIHATVDEILYNRGLLNPSDYYFYSRMPNNLNLSAFFVILGRILIPLNVNYYMVSLLISNFLVNLAGFFTYLSVYRITKKIKYSIFAWVLFILLVGLSPWITIPYSDTYSILFPILAFYLYLSRDPKKNNYGRWFFIGFLCFLGFTIKPIVIINLIAIVLIEIYKLSKNIEKNIQKTKILSFFFIIVSIIPIMIINIYCRNIMEININKNERFTLFHLIMVGLNKENDGAYWENDFNFSASFKTVKERNIANIDVIKDRLVDFGFVGYLNFLSKKTLVNFSDGSFAWNCEGNFYSEVPERENSLSQFLQNIYFRSGKYHQIFLTFLQFLWFTILILLLGVCTNIKILDFQITTLLLTLVGVILFVMLFEARARYLFSYSPFFIIGATVGANQIGSSLFRYSD